MALYKLLCSVTTPFNLTKANILVRKNWLWDQRYGSTFWLFLDSEFVHITGLFWTLKIRVFVTHNIMLLCFLSEVFLFIIARRKIGETSFSLRRLFHLREPWNNIKENRAVRASVFELPPSVRAKDPVSCLFDSEPPPNPAHPQRALSASQPLLSRGRKAGGTQGAPSGSELAVSRGCPGGRAALRWQHSERQRGGDAAGTGHARPSLEERVRVTGVWGELTA